MERNFKFAVEEIQKINLEDYDDDEFAIARMGFLSDRPNSHGLKISADVLRESAKSVLGKWVVADMAAVFDAGTHTDNQKIVGRIPENQEVEFVVDEDGYTRAYVDTVISKIYARDYCAIFEGDNNRAVSVEMLTYCDEDDEDLVLSFNIVGVTTLGHTISPSCPKSDITFTRFSDSEADSFFTKVQNNHLTALETFAKDRKEKMAEKKVKSYKVDKSKEAMSAGSWSDVDKTDLRNKIIEAKNANALVKSVYLKVDADWQSAPSEKLHYPVMQFKGDTLVYNKNALSNAKARAVQNNESEVVKKIDKIYKSLDIGNDNEGKEETAKMSKEIEFAAVNIGNMWDKVYSIIRAHEAWRYCIEGIYEEDNKKFAVLRHEDGTLFRLDFSLTEDGMTAADELIEIKQEFIETDKVARFAEPKNVEDYRKFANDDKDDKGDDSKGEPEGDDDEGKTKMSAEEMEAAMAQLKQDIEDRDNIIMEKDAELADLRAFKKGVEDKEKAMSIEAVMEEIKGFVDETKFKEFRDEGLACEMAEVDAWKNKVKAFCFEAGVKHPKKIENSIFSFAMDVERNEQNGGTVWDRLRKL